jgi:sterol desaturase/sphingolipid hydroxylase (fatty acid hydroxylase superfamily)
MDWLRERIALIDLQTLQLVVVVAGLIGFAIAETLVPDQREALAVRTRNGARNLALYLIGIVLTTIVIGTFYYLGAAFLAANRVGLLYVVPVPTWLGLLLAFLALDFTDYLFHRISHEKKWLWVMHAVHHSDPRLDVTTQFRAHPVHLIVGLGWRIVVIAAVGIPFWLVMLRDAWSTLLVQWQHANVRVPARLDRALRVLIVTPLMHRIHHSPLPDETDSNFGGLLTIWDRLLGTYRAERLPSDVRYGLRQLAGPQHQTIVGMLLTPLRAWTMAGRL